MKKEHPIKKYLQILISIGISYSAGLIGSIFTVEAISGWYATINKPSFNPPSWVFSPVWTILYTLMGIAAYLVWKDRNKKKIKTANIALTFFGIQLVLNGLWSILFFGLNSPSLAFFEIMLLWIAIIFTIIYFFKINKTAAYLLIPYILWVSFAAFLNLNIWILNP